MRIQPAPQSKNLINYSESRDPTELSDGFFFMYRRYRTLEKCKDCERIHAENSWLLKVGKFLICFKILFSQYLVEFNL